ncbi:MAG TPA: OmpA family protein [Thermoanaerobaculia bacterium]|jgi:outer membrane protein OmpA-like peptidoglycan-associated protein
MSRFLRVSLLTLAAVWLATPRPAAADVQLTAVQFPERSSIDLKMVPTNRVAPAEAEAEVKFKDGQARVEIEYEHLPPAILFGGDVTSYVVWAVARDGNAENLGELIVHDPRGKAEYRTGQKEFALIITAEPYPLVLKPSDLVVFVSGPPPVKKARSTPVTFSGLAAGARRGNEQIGGMSYSGSDPLELVQARAVLSQAQRMGAEKYNPDAMRDAGIALAQADNSFRAGRTRLGVDYARRSLSLSSTAIRDTNRNLAEQAAAAAAARRAAEMDALQQQTTAAKEQAETAQQQAFAAREQALAAREQAAAAQQQLAEAQRQAADAQQELSSLEQQARQAQQDAAAAQDRAAAAGLSIDAADAARRDAEEARRKAENLAAQADAARAEAERTSAEVAAKAATLEQQKQQLQAENERLVRERDDLAARLTGALSQVASITTTARGVVVNLPDILFDTNKATLKQNAQIALGKLAGIVSLFPNINLRVEGHTDSTGTDEINNRLSRERANSVMAFLRNQGVAERRMTAEGYGSRLPVGSNSTVEGRAKNRRVEIILAEGVIQGAGGD